MWGMDYFFWHITKLCQSVIENRKKITVAIPAPVSGLAQQIEPLSLLEKKNQKLHSPQPKIENIS